MSELIIDDREKQLISTLTLKAVDFKKQRLQLGDIAVLNNDDNEISIYERKTLADFAASMKDGRYLNIIKLANSRTINVKPFLIIEGKTTAKSVGRVSVEVIEKEINSLTITYNLPIFRTNSANDTVKLIMQIMNKVDVITIDPVLNVLRKMWSTFSGLNVTNCDFFLYKFSVNDILCGKIDWKTLTNQYGKKLSKKCTASLTHITRDLEIRILSKIPQISKDTAKSILLDVPSLKALISYDVDAISMIQSIGKTKAEKIKFYFHTVAGAAVEGIATPVGALQL
jgi:ERCC4-type nuclease